MSKRYADGDEAALKDRRRPDAMEMEVDNEMGEFEDEFEDEFESEDEIMEAGVDGRPDAEREAEEKEEAMKTEQNTFIVGRTKLEPGQILAPDPSTYDMLHSLSTPWPCLSFDIVPDGLGDNRTVYPATMYTVAGTQADCTSPSDNSLLVMKLSGLGKMERANDDSDDDNDDDAEDSDPILESKAIPLPSTTNRVRVHQQSNSRTMSAAMTESAEVYIHDITPHLSAFDTPGAIVSAESNKPLHTIKTHRSEGYAIDWTASNSNIEPKLLTGDNDGLIYLTSTADAGRFVTHEKPFRGHTSSVEDLQWSPSEASVFASASADGTVRIWDIRSKSKKAALSVQVSNVDVNVISWSRQTTHLLASGADDGAWAVWDLRNWKASGAAPAPIASFDYHKEQVTSIEWHPTDDSIVAVGAGDSTVTLWDLAVELDDEESKDTAGVQDIPPQLLFVHYLADVKEVHWHKQIPGTLLATGEQFNAFKTISV
ncbi:Ribosome assembly protein rrb1 [Ceratocystis pirilliformis]|uniref:Glutamate-rich WD repeat-containing protein 1 n=1 Tax=Ceratocystis pirilliformis TaxID=259994 RepID=A0ABR3YYA5_9PEZI